ncbi:MAG: hypothetical protein IJJ14_03495, partial [Coriobacteriales bacterium]|nr:hypothetical protein [Coriobacteriales bacterium]
RLKLNSLTGAYSAGNRFAMRERRGLSYVYGETSREPVQQQVKTVIRAALCRAALRGAKLGNVGDAPQGFEFGNVADDELLRVFGMTQERVPVEQLMEKAATCPESEMRKRLDEAREVFVGFDAIPQENREGYARLMWAYEDYVAESGVVAVASRCWPDFFTRYGTPVCAVLSLLNDRGIPAACEGDSAGALTMLIGSFLSGQSVFFGDPCAIDTNKDTVTFWHCGMAAPSLASPTTGACVGVHPNRRIGPVMDFGCKESSSVTIFRIGHKPGGGLRMFLASGSTFESPKHYEGTNLVVHWDGDVRRMVEDSIHSGWEPHFVVAYGWLDPELSTLADWLGIPVERY